MFLNSQCGKVFKALFADFESKQLINSLLCNHFGQKTSVTEELFLTEILTIFDFQDHFSIETLQTSLDIAKSSSVNVISKKL